MSSQPTEAPWKAIARRKQDERASRIPPKWHIARAAIPRDPPTPRDGPQNVLDLPRRFLTPSEISITESYSVPRLLEAISSRRLSAEEVAEAHCHRAAVAHQLTNCLTEPLFDAALERARFLDGHLRERGAPLGPLHGLPVSVKDTFDVAGVDTSMGLAHLCHKPAARDAPLVGLLLSLGCVVVAKTNVPQTLGSLDSVNNVFGRTMNPINRLCTAGGSSGGEAVLVAMRGSMIGIGTDLGGSIRVPAMCNGVYGLKPSNGRLPYGGVALTGPDGMGRASVQPVAGPIGRSVEDIDALLRELVPRAALWGEDCVPASWPPPPAPRGSPASGSGKHGELVIGVLRSDGNCSILPPVANMMDEVAYLLATTPGVKVVELGCPAAWTRAQYVMNRLMAVDGGAAMADMIDATGEPLVPWTAARFKRGQGPQPLARVAELQAQRAQLEREMLEGIWVEEEEEEDDDDDDARGRRRRRRRQKVDALVCPVAPHPVPPIDGYNAVGMTSSWALLDYPAGTVPVRDVKESDLQLGRPQGGAVLGSWDERNRELWDEGKVDRRMYLGTPLSVQVVVPRLRDDKLVEVMGCVDAACKGKGGNAHAKL
ncbi:amidase [Colletotrichum falcatum]|nr:amidase [Colletotrichum falcatum]